MIDPDLQSALENNHVTLPAEPAEVVAMIQGENEGPSWHWIVRLADDSWAYFTGGCDNTGWDCHSNLDAFLGATRDAVMAQVPEVERVVLADLIERGVPSVAAGSW